MTALARSKLRPGRSITSQHRWGLGSVFIRWRQTALDVSREIRDESCSREHVCGDVCEFPILRPKSSKLFLFSKNINSGFDSARRSVALVSCSWSVAVLSVIARRIRIDLCWKVNRKINKIVHFGGVTAETENSQSSKSAESDVKRSTKSRTQEKFRMTSQIEMASTHRLSLLFIILISGFKLGIAAPADGTKGTNFEPKRNPSVDCELKVLPPCAVRETRKLFYSRQMLQLIKNRWKKYKLVKRDCKRFCNCAWNEMKICVQEISLLHRMEVVGIGSDVMQMFVTLQLVWVGGCHRLLSLNDIEVGGLEVGTSPHYVHSTGRWIVTRYFPISLLNLQTPPTFPPKNYFQEKKPSQGKNYKRHR